MAGGFGVKFDPKNKKKVFAGFSNEVIKDSPIEKPKNSLGGFLRPGESVSFGRQENKPLFLNHLVEEEKVIFAQEKQEIQKAIEDLRSEIKKLIENTEGLDKSLEKAVLEPVVEATAYQISFLSRIRNLLAQFRLNICQASVWVEAFSAKKKKRNFFWSTVKNKKGGGEQYLFSNEHSAARSAT